MKNTFRFFALAAVVAAFASCDKIQDEVPAVKEGRTISLTVGTETKTILKTSGAIWWLSTDRLCVFDNTAAPFQFTFTGDSNTSASATFVNDNYTGSTPVYAVHFDRNTIEQASYDGTKVITGQVKAAQSIMNKKSFAKDASFSVGKIVQNGDNYSVETMKNCFSLIKFQLNAADIDAISVKGLNNEILAGWVDVDCDKLAAEQSGWWTANTTKGAATEIELTVSGSGATNGHFAANSEYYIAVLPQTLSGLEITLTKSNGGTATRTINSSIVLNRSQIKSFEAPLDQGLTFTGDIVLDCTDASQFVMEGGGTFPTRKNKASASFKFWLTGKPEYVFEGNAYIWQNHLAFGSGSLIQLPNITGYTLVEMSVTSHYAPSTSPTYRITDGTTFLASASIGSAGPFPVVFDVSAHPQTSASPNRYLSAAGEGNIKFTLKYTTVSN